MVGTEANLTTWVFVLFERIADWSLHARKHRLLEELGVAVTVHRDALHRL